MEKNTNQNNIRADFLERVTEKCRERKKSLELKKKLLANSNDINQYSK